MNDFEVNVTEEIEVETESIVEVEVELEPSGPRGQPGLSAYDIYVKNGGQLTETEWLESLKGEKGNPFTYEDFTDEQLEELKGEPGVDGTTPVKGIDYWTEEDINTINSYCDEKITNAIGGALDGSY